MGLSYLWDTNTVIYYLRRSFKETNQHLMDNIINADKPAISVVTEIELLWWKTTNQQVISVLESFISDCLILELDTQIKINTIKVRKIYHLKLPDAVIAATAMVMNITLISTDKRGFNKISGLQLLNLN